MSREVEYAAVILMGGAGRRLGGRNKAAVTVGGVALLERVRAACAAATACVPVGQECGGGPAAAAVAGLQRLSRQPLYDAVAFLAVDQPFVTVDALEALAAALPGYDGALYVDAAGQRQYLCSMWMVESLFARVEAFTGQQLGGQQFTEQDSLSPFWNVSLRKFFSGLHIAELESDSQPPPWYDCDTPDQLRAAETWLREPHRLR